MGAPSVQVLFVTDKFAPHRGGTAVVYAEWCKRFPPNSVRVLTTEFPGWRDADLRRTYPVHRVPFLDIPKVRMPLVWFQLFLRAVRELGRTRACVLHCGQILETGWYAPWLKRRFGVPYIVHTYGEELSAYARSPRLRSQMCRVLAEAAGVTAVSHYTAGLLRGLLEFHGPVTIVHPGVDTSRFVPGSGAGVRGRFGLGQGPVLLTLSRLMRRKGHDHVLQALPRIRRRFPGLRYAIAGSGPEEVRLRGLVRDSGLDDCVRFLGRIPSEDVVPLMQAADLFVHPNRELDNGDVEGFGIVFLEAGACALPVVGGNSGGTPDAVRDGVTGFLVDPEDPEEIAARVTHLLDDGELRQRMGRAGREWAAQFTWERSASRVWTLSQEAAGRAQ